MATNWIGRPPSEQERIPVVCIINASVWVATTRCCSRRSLNEQVWTGLHWSAPDGTSRGDWEEVPRSDFCERGVPYHATYPMIHFDVTYPVTPVKTLPSTTSFAAGKNPESSPDWVLLHVLTAKQSYVICYVDEAERIWEERWMGHRWTWRYHRRRNIHSWRKFWIDGNKHNRFSDKVTSKTNVLCT